MKPGEQSSGCLVVNADDWGQDRQTTAAIYDCVRSGAVSSVSAMVFMEDSARAASLAQADEIDAGLHLNLTDPFTDAGCPAGLASRQQELARYLRRHRLAQVMFHPGLVNAFDYVVTAQIEEFHRLYDRPPDRLDGHHHMHLCANVLLQDLLPADRLVRRNFSFMPGEKGTVNRAYRRVVDALLGRRHRMVDHLFSIQPLAQSARLDRIISIARQKVVELETHPGKPDEYRFIRDELAPWMRDLPLVAFSDLTGSPRALGRP